jgi:dihydroorotase
MTPGVVIRGVRLLDPFTGCDRLEDVVVRDGVFAPHPAPDDHVIEGHGLWLIPRLTDLHVHLRDPGQTHKETLDSGLAAATAGGFTVVGAMPNTVPTMDDPALIQDVMARAAALDRVTVWPIAAATRGLQGQDPAPWAALAKAGARAFSDDGRPVARSGVMAALLLFSAASGRPVIQHLEDPDLARDGVAHAGPVADRLGLPGMPAGAESVMAWRDVALVDAYGGRLHLAHCSVPGTLEALRWARARGLRITGEATPHHLLLTDEELQEWDRSAVTKVNPPLRPEAMRRALVAAVVEGVVSVIASDHAPHHADEKARPFEEAPFGISGVETAIGAAFTALLPTGRISPLELAARFSRGPHEVMGESWPGVVPGAPADLTLVDPAVEWVVDPARFVSRGHNTPLAGRRLRGRAVATMRQGRWVYREGMVLDA